MRAVICSELGPPSLLRLEERPELSPSPTGVVVEVEAAGVNFVDALFVAGKYQIKPPLPFTPGSEVAGRVAALGAEVSGWAIGDRVMATTGLGGFASQVMVPALSLVALPDVLDAPRAATFTQSFSTCLYALRERAAVGPGTTVLVLGAGGGIGLAAIAVANALGCRVLAAASSVEKQDAASRAGADATLNTATDDLKTVAREWAGGAGVDVVLDPIGGPLAEPSLRALGEGGHYLVIGFASGEIPRLPLNQVLLRNRTIVGIDWGMWSMQHGMENLALSNDLMQMVARGEVEPVQPTTYDLADVARALDDLLARRVVGKIALLP